jgi:hypothetical protein
MLIRSCKQGLYAAHLYVINGLTTQAHAASQCGVEAPIEITLLLLFTVGPQTAATFRRVYKSVR